MPPSDRNNADERRARIERLLEELRAKTETLQDQVHTRAAKAKKGIRQAKAHLTPRRSRAGKKR
jgi:hypothetical protein